MKNIMPPPRILCASLLIALAGTPAASAAINIADSATLYNPDNWYAVRNGGTPTFSASDNSLKISVLSDDSHVFAYMNPVSLAIGENLQISFNVNFTSPKALGSFAFGVFNSGNLTQPILDALLAENSIATHGINSKGKSDTLGIKALTGEMNGIFATPDLVFSRFAGTTSTGFMATNPASDVGKKTNLSVAQNSPSVGVSYAVQMEIARVSGTEKTYEVGVSFGGSATETLTIENSQVTFDLLGFRSPVGGTANGMTLSDLRISTTGTIGVPEPSAFGLLAGIVGLALAVSRRRRSRNS